MCMDGRLYTLTWVNTRLFDIIQNTRYWLVRKRMVGQIRDELYDQRLVVQNRGQLYRLDDSCTYKRWLYRLRDSCTD